RFDVPLVARSGVEQQAGHPAALPVKVLLFELDEAPIGGEVAVQRRPPAGPREPVHTGDVDLRLSRRYGRHGDDVQVCRLRPGQVAGEVRFVRQRPGGAGKYAQSVALPKYDDL